MNEQSTQAAGSAKEQFDLGVKYFYGNGIEKNLAEAVRWWKTAAEQGQAEAQYNLGVCYNHGWGVEKNLAEAVRWWKMAAEQGKAEAQCALGDYFDAYARGDGRDPAEAVRWWKMAAEKGYAQAQSKLVACYFYGKGVKKNLWEAFRWCQKAAEQGYAAAQSDLGYMFYFGGVIAQNYVTAAKWTIKAAEQGYAEAQFILGRLYADGNGVQKNDELAISWYNKAAEQGLEKAQHYLKFTYPNGSTEPQDWLTKVKVALTEKELKYKSFLSKDELEKMTAFYQCYAQATEQGNSDVQNKLGDMYLTGTGVEEDLVEAARWYQKAAEQGHAEAQYNLGLMYISGEGVIQSTTDANRLIKQAAEQEYPDACYTLGRRIETGEGVSQNDIEAVRLYTIAAEKGCIMAQYHLGSMYYNGIIVDRDDVQATRWFRKAAEQAPVDAPCYGGGPLVGGGWSPLFDAQIQLAWMYRFGHGVHQDEYEAKRWYSLAYDTRIEHDLRDRWHEEYSSITRGHAYKDGRDGRREMEYAARYRSAATLGDAEAQFRLGFMYLCGVGVPKSAWEAFKWFTKAADQGHSGAIKEAVEAQYQIGFMFGSGVGLPKSAWEEFKWFAKAADQGHSGATKEYEYISNVTQSSYKKSFENAKPDCVMVQDTFLNACVAYLARVETESDVNDAKRLRNGLNDLCMGNCRREINVSVLCAELGVLNECLHGEKDMHKDIRARRMGDRLEEHGVSRDLAMSIVVLWQHLLPFPSR